MSCAFHHGHRSAATGLAGPPTAGSSEKARLRGRPRASRTSGAPARAARARRFQGGGGPAGIQTGAGRRSIPLDHRHVLRGTFGRGRGLVSVLSMSWIGTAVLHVSAACRRIGQLVTAWGQLARTRARASAPGKPEIATGIGTMPRTRVLGGNWGGLKARSTARRPGQGRQPTSRVGLSELLDRSGCA